MASRDDRETPECRALLELVETSAHKALLVSVVNVVGQEVLDLRDSLDSPVVQEQLDFQEQLAEMESVDFLVGLEIRVQLDSRAVLVYRV